jgi:hypothetical protein
VRPTRRQFILAGAATAVLAACGSDGTAKAGYQLAPRLTNSPLLVPGESRVAISLVQDQTLVASGPASLKADILDSNGKVVTTATAEQHASGIPQAYWPFRFTIAAGGFYRFRISGADSQTGDVGVFDPAQVSMPYIGATLQPFDTPTVDDHRGVEPYCSLTPNPCPLHDVTLTQALQAGKPLVFMVGTPAHCQTGACAPALEFLVNTHARVGDAAVMVHADVYADNAGTQEAPIISALGLDYEPVVYLAAPGGKILDRLDGIWDQTEIDQRVDALLNLS